MPQTQPVLFPEPFVFPPYLMPQDEREAVQDTGMINVMQRDKELFYAIYRHNGVLADYQLLNLQYFGSLVRLRERTKQLVSAGYLTCFGRKERNSYDYQAYFLDREGITYICRQEGVTPKELLLRRKGERDGLIHHDVVLNDLRFALFASLPAIGAEHIESRTTLAFDSDPDQITYPHPSGKGETKRVMKIDSMEHILLPNGKHRRFLLEAELSRKDKPRMFEEKFLPQLHYLRSKQYLERFRLKKPAGSYLYFFHDDDMAYSRKRTAERLGSEARVFFFTTFTEALTAGAFLTEKIWYRGGAEEKHALIDPTSFDTP